jgi:hypothetical protein
MAQDSFLNQVYQGTGLGSYVKDYKHAARLFVDGNYRLSPKMGFLFHVAFDLDRSLTRMQSNDILEAGMLVKSVQLPKYTFDTKTNNAYNRPNVVQTKIKYDPITITFHDDSADVIRDLWYDYMSYYYRDTDYSPSKYLQNTKYNTMDPDHWGFTPSGSVTPSTSAIPTGNRLLQTIRLYSLHQKQFTEYVLINPTITSFQHGQHQNSGDAAPMEHTMTVAYETVLYNYGSVSTGNAPTGFATLHYDGSPSPLGLPSLAGSLINSVTGGGIGGTVGSVINSLTGQQPRVPDTQLPGNRTPFATAKGVGGVGSLLSQIALGISKGNNPLQNLTVPTLAGYATTLTGSGGISGLLGAAGGLSSPNGSTPGSLLSSATSSVVSFFKGSGQAPVGSGASSNGELVNQSSTNSTNPATNFNNIVTSSSTSPSNNGGVDQNQQVSNLNEFTAQPRNFPNIGQFVSADNPDNTSDVPIP